MERIGSYLKREREFRQISVEEITAVTRITHTCIEAIERDDFEALPAATFVRGYLKAYARHIGLDPADVLLRYEQWLVHEEGQESDAPPAEETKKKKKWRWKYLWITFVAAGIIGLAAFLSYR